MPANVRPGGRRIWRRSQGFAGREVSTCRAGVVLKSSCLFSDSPLTTDPLFLDIVGQPGRYSALERQPSRGNGGSLGNYQSSRDANKLGNRGSDSLQNSRSKPAGSLSNDSRSRSNVDRSRSNAGAFGGYGSGKGKEVIEGFDVNKGSGGSALGPSGIAYWCGGVAGSGMCPQKNNPPDTLYVADGACNAVIAISHASTLLLKDEITIGSGCTKFTCKYPKTSCATVVKAG